jgi:catechol 2,3-dioxygenase-like lactoylglutathione lyase family enzyme
MGGRQDVVTPNMLAELRRRPERWGLSAAVAAKAPACAAALVFLAASLTPFPAAAQQVQPWSEAVVSVTDIAATARLFREVGGWTRTHRGKVDRAELNYWRLPATAGARFERWCAPGATAGCIRFVRFTGVAQRPIRLAARAWDTGGIYSVMVRSDNVQDLFNRAIALGWWAEAEPIRFQFGASDLSNVVLTGPHGINLAVYQRHSPPFTAFPVGLISQGFNAMRMVKSRPAARAFYEQTLGFSVLFDSDREPAEPTRSNFGIPFNLTPTVKRAAAALQPVAGLEFGRVEVMQIEGFTGGDMSAHASPPNLGIVSVRFPVTNLAAYRAQLEARGVAIAYAANAVPVGGLGRVTLIAVRDPDGNISEFYETAKDLQ